MYTLALQQEGAAAVSETYRLVRAVRAPQEAGKGPVILFRYRNLQHKDKR